MTGGLRIARGWIIRQQTRSAGAAPEAQRANARNRAPFEGAKALVAASSAFDRAA
jgi:hypothetical protein